MIKTTLFQFNKHRASNKWVTDIRFRSTTDLTRSEEKSRTMFNQEKTEIKTALN